uniref:Uncharacterized protein n=1 Tax=Malurus cyaneus samueli TaxID=2593467 RepID=A0A8C5XA55_9PASS
METSLSLLLLLWGVVPEGPVFVPYPDSIPSALVVLWLLSPSAVCCTSRGHCENNRGKGTKFPVCAEPRSHVLALWSCCSQEKVPGIPEELLQELLVLEGCCEESLGEQTSGECPWGASACPPHWGQRSPPLPWHHPLT